MRKRLPARYGSIANALSAAGVLLAVTAAAGAVAGLIARWRRGGPRVRQQLLFLALAACPPAFIIAAVILANGVPAWLFGVAVLWAIDLAREDAPLHVTPPRTIPLVLIIARSRP
jgi:hypothetical protein